MKVNTYFNKIKQIRDKAVNASATAISAPDIIKSKTSQAKSYGQFNALKMANNFPKNAPDYDADGNVTDAFKVRSVANGIKSKMKK